MTMQGAKSYLEILGTHSEETTPSIMVTSNDTTRLLFNFGEGLIRSSTEHNIKPTRASHLFVTHLSSESLSDFTSFFLRSHLTGTRNTKLWGPQNLANFINTKRFFFNRGNHTINVTECDGGERIEIDREGPEVEVIAINSFAPKFDTSILPEVVAPSIPNAKQAVDLSKVHYIKGRSGTYTDFLHFLKMRAGLVDGYRHMDRELNERFFAEYPHPTDNVIPADYYGEITDNNKNPDPRHLGVSSRYFRIDLKSSRVRDESEEDRIARLRLRAQVFSECPIFGPTKSFLHTIPPPTKNFAVLSYLIRTPVIKGTFDTKKAQALGVPRGPAFGILQKGGSFKTAAGREVKPEDVMSPSTPGPIFAIVSCTHEAMLPDLFNHATWQSLKNNNETISCVVHLAPRDIIDSPLYKSFILERFNDKCQHIFVGRGMARQHPIYIASTKQTCILNSFNSKWFPVPCVDDYIPTLPEDLPIKSVQGDHYMKFVGVPLEKMGLFTGDCKPRFELAEIQREFSKSNPAIVENDNSSSSLSSLSSDDLSSGIADDELEIVFFGTGCSAASTLRNETAIYLNFFSKGGMLMDVGSGTYGQMYRKYGPKKVIEVLSGIKAIWISHTHADHIQGITHIMHMRHLALMELGKEEDKILIIGPHTLYNVLEEHTKCTICACKYKKDLHPEFLFNFVDSFDLQTPTPLLKDYFGLVEVFSVPVLHAFMTHAIMIKHINGWSLVFSGDTAYCTKLIEACRSPTVLIHEASFEDALEDKAAAKAHCTTTQAIETGEKMNAGCTLLTHFSQRYRNLSQNNNNNNNVAMAFDFMSVNLADYKLVSRFGSMFASLGKISSLVGEGDDDYVDLE